MIIATNNAVYRLERDGSENTPMLLRDRLPVRRVAEGAGRIVVATAENRLLLLDVNEEQWLETGIKNRIDALCIVREHPLDLLIGTTPPYLYRMGEVGPAAPIKTFDELDVRRQWYTPWGGPAAVRSLASTPAGWIYADIHVGSIMRSPDTGRTWEPVRPSLHEDVHEVATTPASERRVYANTYLSVYVSDTQGESWTHRSTGLNNRYGRGIAVNPADPDILLCGVSDGPQGVDVHGQLYYTVDAGVTWTHVTVGFPVSTRKNIDTFHIAYTDKDTAWVTDENALFRSRDRGKTWEAYWKAPEDILMMSCRS